MYLVYIDDSYRKGYYCFSAVTIHEDYWHEAFSQIKEWRRRLKADYGVYVYKELHAVDLVAGRGQIAPHIIGKWQRCGIYKSGLHLLAQMQGVRIFNSCNRTSQQVAFERLLNRINRTMKTADSHALLICDEGDEPGFTRLARKMQVFNPIPSRFGSWGDGKTKNIPTNRIIEDPFFKESSKSYLIQMADFCAYALLQKENPLQARKDYGLHKAWEIIRPKFVTLASRSDPNGIIR